MRINFTFPTIFGKVILADTRKEQLLIWLANDIMKPFHYKSI